MILDFKDIHNTPPKVLAKAIEANLDEVLIIGMKDGEFCYFTSCDDAVEIVGLMNAMDKFIMQCEEEIK